MPRSKTNTGFRGVSVRKNTGKFETRVKVGSESYYIGMYDTLQEAVNKRIEFINNLY